MMFVFSIHLGGTMEKLWSTLGTFTDNLMQPIISLFSWTGNDAVGWALVGLAVAWRLPLLPLEVRSAKRRIRRAAIYDEIVVGRDMRSRETRREVNSDVNSQLAREATENAWRSHPLALPSGVLQALIAVFVLVWARGSETARQNGFLSLNVLGEPGLANGVAGWVLAVIVMAVMFGTSLAVQTASGTKSAHQKIFGLVMGPLMFFVLGLFLPSAVVVTLCAGLAVSLLGVLAAALAMRGHAAGPALSNRGGTR